ncbi:hypothetical protein HDV00_002486 [Rhizophlyctis rosea]|nr:hypothetical protein HDV00_002486 [Rhizophlyctis rosea]
MSPLPIQMLSKFRTVTSLAINNDTEPLHCKDLLQLLSCVPGRLKHLNLNVTGWDLFKTIEGLDTQPALESLTLRVWIRREIRPDRVARLKLDAGILRLRLRMEGLECYAYE